MDLIYFFLKKQKFLKNKKIKLKLNLFKHKYIYNFKNVIMLLSITVLLLLLLISCELYLINNICLPQDTDNGILAIIFDSELLNYMLKNFEINILNVI